MRVVMCQGPALHRCRCRICWQHALLCPGRMVMKYLFTTVTSAIFWLLNSGMKCSILLAYHIATFTICCCVQQQNSQAVLFKCKTSNYSESFVSFIFNPTSFPGQCQKKQPIECRFNCLHLLCCIEVCLYSSEVCLYSSFLSSSNSLPLLFPDWGAIFKNFLTNIDQLIKPSFYMHCIIVPKCHYVPTNLCIFHNPVEDRWLSIWCHWDHCL